MPAKRTRVNALEIATTSKRPRVAARHRGTASQPVLVDTRPFSPSPPPPPLSPRQALVAAPQAPNFEATLRESRAEETIIPPPEGSEHATVAASGAASEAVDEGFVWVEDKYDGFNWSRYPKHCKPPTSLSNRASWVYSHGYRIALRSNVAKVTWICHYCYKHKFTTVGRGIHDVSQSPSAPARHLGEDKKGHGLKPPSKRTTVAPRKETLLERALQKGCSQAVANELTNFNIQEFRLAAVTWLVENNLPLSQFESSSFRNMIQLASVEAERALWASHNSVSRYVIRLYNYLLPKVVASLSESMSKVHISFDGWTTKGGKRGYLGIVAHYVDSSGELRDLPIALPQLTGAHTGEAMAEVVMAIFKQFEITVGKLGYFVLDNAHNNNTTINTLALQMGFSATERRLRCGPHTLNLIGQMLLWGEEKESYDNEETERVNEAENMATWRGDGPLGVLLAVINYIKTPQQYALFEKYQKLAIRDQPVNAPTEQHKIKEPVKPVVTRWNSYVSCFERAVELQLAVNGYANYHIQKIETEDAYARSRNNKLPAAPDWMRSDGINAHDWQVIAEYIDVLRPLKQATKRLEGRGKSGAFGAIAEVIPVFEYLLGVYEDRLQSYEDVIHDEHTESPEDHLAINLRAALVKAREYYNKLDLSPAYYAATILHPRYKSYLDAAWADKPDWLESSNRKFQHLWAEYKSLPKPRLRPKVRHNDIDDAINSFIEPAGLTENEEDEYEAWKRSEPIASEGVDPIKYWVGLRDRYPSLSKFAIDMLSIPGSSCECERLFSELGDLLEPRRRSISPQLLAAIQCDRRWIRAGFGSGEVPVKEAISDEEMDAKYGVHNYTRKNWVVPLKQKGDAQKELRAWKIFVEHQTDEKVKAAGTDNAPELLQQVEEWRVTYGVELQPTTIASSYQNGPAERNIQPAEADMRAMLKDAGLPIEFWDEAVEADAYLRNRTSTGPTIDGKQVSPEEAFTGRTPSIDHIRVWGSRCYSYINPKTIPADQRHDKLVDRGRIGVFMGYSETTNKQFKFYSPELGYTSRSSRISVDEYTPGGKVELRLRNIPAGPQGTQNIMPDRKPRGRPRKDLTPTQPAHAQPAPAEPTPAEPTPAQPTEQAATEQVEPPTAEEMEPPPAEQMDTSPAEQVELNPEPIERRRGRPRKLTTAPPTTVSRDERVPDLATEESEEPVQSLPEAPRYFTRGSKRKRAGEDTAEDERFRKIIKAMLAQEPVFLGKESSGTGLSR
ncbi:Dimer-Tnp-hAT dimerization containing protein [Pyrenophora tritici-repentis]|nr:Dimer-Tnp-hAT dimerization containing protein [Pyrenophora tritici-repentis]